MTRAAKVFGGVVVPVTDTDNLEGFPAYERPLKEKYLQLLLTNTLGNAFYASAKDLLAETETLHAAMLAEDPAFMAKAVVYARNEGFMRTQPTYGLAVLSKQKAFTDAFPLVIQTPNDLSDFTTILKRLRKGEGGRKVKRAAGLWLTKHLTEYWAIKYGAEKPGDYSLRDLLCVYHPKTGEPRGLFHWLIRPDVCVPPEGSQLAAFEKLKKATTPEEKAEAITMGRLPHEVASTFAGSSKVVWRAIVPQLPAFALLRNLATLERHRVAEENRETITAILTDAARIRRAKILPFRFLDAMEKVEAGWLRDVLRLGIEHTFDALPDLPGRTAVHIDISPSMNGMQKRVAAIFGISLFKKSRASVRVFDFHSKVFHASMLDSTLTQAEAIVALPNNGTDVGAPIRDMIAEGEKVDNIVTITDEQQNAGMPFYHALLDYRDKVAPHVKVFLVNVAPYTRSGSVAFRGDPLVYPIYGWSDQVLKFISMGAKGFGTMVQEIEK